MSVVLSLPPSLTPLFFQAGHTAYDLASVELKQSQILKLDYSTRQGLVVAVREGNSEKLREILEIDRSAINQKDSVSI
jgi:hypothetical protein